MSRKEKRTNKTRRMRINDLIPKYKNVPFNGLSQTDMVALSKFTFVVENQHFKRCSSLVKFNNRKNAIDFGLAFNTFNQKLATRIKSTSNSHEINVNSIKTRENSVTFFFIKSNKILGFCKHLRNSFCHANLCKQNKKLFISDVGANSRYTSIGFLPYEEVIEFVNQINEIYSDNIKK